VPVALNKWWVGHPDQRYWMEITDRDDVGSDLNAPQLDVRGNEPWSYALVAEVQPGDRVLHYKTNHPGGGALIGWSEVTDAASEGVISWQAHTAGGEEQGVKEGASWYAPLTGFQAFESPVRGKDLGPIDASVVGVRDAVTSTYGSPPYFPFYQYRPGEVRAQQGYLAKFPLELLDLLPALSAVRDTPRVDDSPGDDEVEEETKPQGSRVAHGRLTRTQDPELRAAIERRSLDVVIDYYTGLGATDIVEVGKPYDLRLTLEGQTRHVEVKGSSLRIESVELTINEVTHAEDFQPTDLAVVDNISYQRQAGAGLKTSGGDLRRWSDWWPNEEDLRATKFSYALPAQHCQ